MREKLSFEKDCKTYMSIRQAAQMTGLGESYLRKGVKNRTVPGFYVAGEGSKFMVNVPLLLKQLDMQSKSNVSEIISEE